MNSITKNDLNNTKRFTNVALGDLQAGSDYMILYPGDYFPLLRTIKDIKKDKNGVVSSIKIAHNGQFVVLFIAGGLNHLKFYKATEAWKVYDLAVSGMTSERQWANNITKKTGRIPRSKNSKTDVLRERGVVENIGSYLGGKKTKRKRKRKRKTKNKR